MEEEKRLKILDPYSISKAKEYEIKRGYIREANLEFEPEKTWAVNVSARMTATHVKRFTVMAKTEEAAEMAAMLEAEKLGDSEWDPFDYEVEELEIDSVKEIKL